MRRYDYSGLEGRDGHYDEVRRRESVSPTFASSELGSYGDPSRIPIGQPGVDPHGPQGERDRSAHQPGTHDEGGFRRRTARSGYRAHLFSGHECEPSHRRGGEGGICQPCRTTQWPPWSRPSRGAVAPRRSQGKGATWLRAGWTGFGAWAKRTRPSAHRARALTRGWRAVPRMLEGGAPRTVPRCARRRNARSGKASRRQPERARAYAGRRATRLAIPRSADLGLGAANRSIDSSG
jgi:hypothetical protein